jgi:Carboxypeptidase regulatory-like domain
MTASRTSIPLLLALALLGTAGRVDAESPHGVGGQVIDESSPLARAGVYAYQLADSSLHKVLTDPQGKFLFQDLPAGLYKIIAHKPGFIPVVVLLTRTAAQQYQFVELQLLEQPSGTSARGQDDFWSIRASVPSDVLREIMDDQQERQAALTTAAPSQRLDLSGVAKSGFQTEMQAMTGVDQIATPDGGLVSGGGVGIQGRLGATQVGLRGSFWRINGDSPVRPGNGSSLGQASKVSLDLSGSSGSRLTMSSVNNRMARPGDGESPIDFEHYQVSYTQGIGDSGRSDFAAQYTSESNYHRQALIDPLEIPEESQTWRIEGAYTTDLGDGSTLQTGARYREIQFGTPIPGRPGDPPAIASVDLFGRGGARVQPAVLVEYGLYSTLSDGSVSLMPQGGVVMQLGRNWQVEGSASRRVYQNHLPTPTFLPTLFEEADLCEQGSEACYQVSVARKPADDSDGSISLTATRREVGDTLRFYFSNEVFDRLESLYLVRGDELPELRLQIRKHITPRVVTTFESSLASGGGGTFVAADQRPYENQVHYVIASLDTQFLSSSTGVFLAFHHLTQQLDPIGEEGGAARMDLERVRLMLTQDLSFLLGMTSDWAVQLNMELSRGPIDSLGTGHDSELRRRLMGGIAVKF